MGAQFGGQATITAEQVQRFWRRAVPVEFGDAGQPRRGDPAIPAARYRQLADADAVHARHSDERVIAGQPFRPGAPLRDGHKPHATCDSCGLDEEAAGGRDSGHAVIRDVGADHFGRAGEPGGGQNRSGAQTGRELAYFGCQFPKNSMTIRINSGCGPQQEILGAAARTSARGEDASGT